MNPATQPTPAPTAAPEFDLAIVGIVGLPARYGGFETLAEHLVRQLGATRRILVFCSAAGSTSKVERYLGATLEYLTWNANGWQSMIYDALAMCRSARRCRTLLVLGVSGCLLLPLVRLFAPRVRIVTNIDGIEWQRQKWGKVARLVLRQSEAVAVRFSHRVVSDNVGIQDHVMARYGRPSTFIPYGGDTTAGSSPATAGRSTGYPPGSYLLTVCRIEPENHIEEILQAVSSLPEHSLVLVGNWNVSPYARALRARYAERPNIELRDPIYEPAALARLRSEAGAYVHGHSAGGTNPSLVEAMHAGLSVFAYDVNYNRHTMAGAGWYWRTPQQLAQLLSTVDAAAIAREATRLRTHAEAHYTWEAVAGRYAQLVDVEPGTKDSP